MTTPNNDGRKMNLLMTALAESVASASDDELLAEARETTPDLKTRTTHLRHVLNDAILKAKKAAQKEHGESQEKKA